MKNFGKLILTSGLLLLQSFAQGVIEIGSPNDLWDLSSGTVITSHSGEAEPYHIENAFGGRLPTVFGAQLFDHIFTDGRPAGYVHFVEWKTPAPVILRSFNLHAQGDGADVDNGREFGTFKLFAKTAGATAGFQLIYQFTPTHPYSFVNYAQRLILSANVGPLLAQEFRAEFTDRANRFWSGPRIIELDGFSTIVAAEIRPAVELIWTVTPGLRYQIQVTDSLPSGVWTNFSDPFVASSGSYRHFDSTQPGGARFYRIKEVQ
jgi:hypothetical protein